MTIADININSVKIDGTEVIDDSGNINLRTNNSSSGISVKNNAGDSVTRLAVDNTSVGLVILNGADGNTYKLYFNAAGNLDSTVI